MDNKYLGHLILSEAKHLKKTMDKDIWVFGTGFGRNILLKGEQLEGQRAGRQEAINLLTFVQHAQPPSGPVQLVWQKK